MKKFVPILLAIPALILSSCNSRTDNSKIALDYGYIRNVDYTDISQFGELSYSNLQDLVADKESFVLVIFGSRTCLCWTNFNPLLVRYANEYHVEAKIIDANTLEGEAKFGLYTASGQMPSIAFFRRGKLVRQTVYGKLNDNNKKIFKNYDSLVKFMNKNVYLPNMYYLDKEVLDNKISQGDEFSLYVARGNCPDCRAIDSSALYSWNDKNHNTTNKLYILDIDPWYAKEPKNPEDPDYDEKMAKYEAYLLLKTNYGLSYEGNELFGYGTGCVPTFQKRSGTMITDMITVLNDTADENYRVSSYFNTYRIGNSPLLRNTGETYLFDGRIVSEDDVEYWGAVSQELQLKWHTPIVHLFLDEYVK